MNPLRLLLSAAVLLLPASVPAADIVALCIGNDAYHKPEDVLDTPVADATLMKNTLKALPGGADVVLLTNGSREEIVIALNSLAQRARGAKLVLVYYSGHGLEGQPDGYVKADTFLLPVEADIPNVNYLPTRAVGLQTVLEAIGKCPVTARAVVLDCCRDGAPKATAALKGSTKSFGDIDEAVKAALGASVVPEATLVAFATSPGRKAAAFLRQSDVNSPFTLFLSESLATGAGNLRDLVETAAERTEEATGKRQVPYVTYTGAASAIRQIVFRQMAVPVVNPPGNPAEMEGLRARLEAAEKAREEAERKAAMAESPLPNPSAPAPLPSTSLPMTRPASTTISGGFPAVRKLPGNPPSSELPHYAYWEKETVSIFERLLVQQDGRFVPLCSVENLSLLPLQLPSSISFKTKDEKVHSISRSEWFLDVLFRADVAKDLPIFVIDDSEVAVEIGVSPKAKDDVYSYNEIAVVRAKLAELGAQYAEKQAQYEKSGKDPQFAPERAESTIIELGRNVSSFEYLVGQFGLARQGDLIVNASVLPPELNELAKRLDMLDMLEKMPEMTMDQLVASIRQQPGESEDERLFSGALRLFYFHANSARGLNLFPSSETDDKVWVSAGDLLLAGLESKESRPWVREQLGVLQSLDRALKRSEAAFRGALDTFVTKQTEFTHAHDEKRPPAAAPSNANSDAHGLVYETPEDWTEVPGIPMQDVSFSFGKEGEGKCFIARVPGAQGGLTPIVNRWRAKMGARPLSGEEVEALPISRIFGRVAPQKNDTEAIFRASVVAP